MLHFFDRFIDEKNEGTGAFGMLTGGVIMLVLFKFAGKFIILLGVWGPVIVTIASSIATVISGMGLIIAKDFYEHKLKHKWFKLKKDDTKKENTTDNEKAA